MSKCRSVAFVAMRLNFVRELVVNRRLWVVIIWVVVFSFSSLFEPIILSFYIDDFLAIILVAIMFIHAIIVVWVSL